MNFNVRSEQRERKRKKESVRREWIVGGERRQNLCLRALQSAHRRNEERRRRRRRWRRFERSLTLERNEPTRENKIKDREKSSVCILSVGCYFCVAASLTAHQLINNRLRKTLHTHTHITATRRRLLSSEASKLQAFPPSYHPFEL